MKANTHEDSDAERLLAGRYRLVEKLGSGGMGIVWRAEDQLLTRPVAVKEVRVSTSLDSEERTAVYQRTLREARAAAQLKHPAVITLHDVVEDDDRPWIVMDLVSGRSLEKLLHDEGPLSVARATDLARQILGALRAAHVAGVLHRDVKPANVLVEDDDRVVLTDFGLAAIEGGSALTRSGEVMGSPEYISPERVNGKPATPAADLWALGVTLFAAVEGRTPYRRDTIMATFSAVLTQPPPPAERAGPLRPVLDGLLIRDPARRMTAEQADRALRRAKSDAARPGGSAPRAAPQPVPRTGPRGSPRPVPRTGSPASRAAPQPPVPPTGPPGSRAAPRPSLPPAGHPTSPPRRWRHRVLPLLLGAAGFVCVLLFIMGTLVIRGLSNLGSQEPPPPETTQQATSPPGLPGRLADRPDHPPTLRKGFVRHSDADDGFVVDLPRGCRAGHGELRPPRCQSKVGYSVDVGTASDPDAAPGGILRRETRNRPKDHRLRHGSGTFLGHPAATREVVYRTGRHATLMHEFELVVRSDQVYRLRLRTAAKRWSRYRAKIHTTLYSFRVPEG